jgi:hypothetical protein
MVTICGFECPSFAEDRVLLWERVAQRMINAQSSFPHAFGGNPEMSAELDSRQKPAGMTGWYNTENPGSLFVA